MKNIIIYSLFVLGIIFMSCNDEDLTHSQFIVEGVKPIYSSNDEWKLIEVLPIQPIQRLGKIYYKDPYIFVNELQRGIHIIDNSIPTNPVRIKFISIPGSKDISIKGDFLYTDNVTDLVVLNISDFNAIEVANRVPNIYPVLSQNFPEFHSGYFECVDPSKGTIIGWESAEITSPDCFK